MEAQQTLNWLRMIRSARYVVQSPRAQSPEPNGGGFTVCIGSVGWSGALRMDRRNGRRTAEERIPAST